MLLLVILPRFIKAGFQNKRGAAHAHSEWREPESRQWFTGAFMRLTKPAIIRLTSLEAVAVQIAPLGTS